MNLFRRHTEEWILALILLMSAVMRLWNYSGWSLSNDELSALYGASLGDFSTMMREYVWTDFHPAGTQIFIYYWIELFGNSEASVRLPFVLAGILSVLFTYLIAARWFNKTTGLFAAAALGFLGYTILYSQLARPYSFGLLFSLMAVYYWTRILFDLPGKRKSLPAIGWAFSLAACMYTHYFSFLFAIMVGATGLLFIKKKNYLAYLVPAAIAVIIYLPHLDIALEQFSKGGVGTWLSPPGENYFWKYLYYCFTDSLFLCIVIMLVVMAAIISNPLWRNWNPFRLIALIWFMVPFLIGYFYSLYVNPVLQYSILIFSFPFLLILLFSFFDPLKKRFNHILLAGLCIAGIYSTVIEFKYYSKQQFGVFKEVAQKTIEWTEKYGEHNITKTVNVIVPFYIHYYLDRYSGEKKMQYSMYEITNAQKLRELKALVDSSKTEYFVHGWSNNYNPYEIWEIIKTKYPVVVEDNQYFNSGVALFKKGPERKAAWSSVNDFSKDSIPGWNNQNTSISIITGTGEHWCVLDSAAEYGPTLTTTAGKVFSSSDYAVVRAMVSTPGETDAQLVISFEGDVKDWASVHVADYLDPLQKGEIILVRKKLPGIKTDDPVKVYLWNPGKKKLYFSEIGVYSYPDSNYNYGY